MTEPLQITNVSILTCDPQGSVLARKTVTVGPDGRISSIDDANEAMNPAGTRVIDGTGKFLMPGLINAHAHLFSDGKVLPAIMTSERAEQVVSLFLRSPVGRKMVLRRTMRNVRTQMNTGVTTIRSLGDVGYEVVRVRDQIEASKVNGPRILAAGPLLAVTGGHGAPLIALTSDSPWEARRNTRTNLRHGVNAIKIAATGGVTDARQIGEAGRPQMTYEEMAAICDEAHNAGLVVAAHAQGEEGVRAALQAGVDTIEHGCPISEDLAGLFNANARSLRGFSALVPTLMAALPIVKLDPQHTKVNPIVRANGVSIFESMVQGVNDAHQHGVMIGMGTDSALTFVTHYNTWRELDYVSRYTNLSPAEALHAATSTNAELLNISDQTGAVEVGRTADLILLAANPTNDLRALADPIAVVVRGELIESPRVERYDQIERLLDQI